MTALAGARWCARGAIAAFVAVLLLVVVDRLAGLGIRFHLLLGVLLLAFGVLKFAVGTEAWLRLRSGAAPAPEAVHGAPGMVMGWVVYKYIAGVVAVAAAIYVLTLNADKVDRVFGL